MLSADFSTRYRLDATLVADGSRRVFQAFDHLLQCSVALKGEVLRSEVPPDLLVRQLRLLRSLPHPALVPVLELTRLTSPPDEPPGWIFHGLSSPWISGPSLLTRRGQLSPAELRQWLLEAVRLVDWLHQAGLTGLDLKSEHFLHDGRRWRLLDIDSLRTDDPFSTGELAGTLTYLAPEVLETGRRGPSADLYALGALLVEAATGAPPALEGQTREALLAALRRRVTPRLPEAVQEAVPALGEICAALLSFAPQDRPPTAAAVLDLLRLPGDVCSLSVMRPPPAALGLEPVLKTLDQAHADAQVLGGGGLVLVGPPRSGRSRTLEALAEHFQGRGGRCFILKPAPTPGADLFALIQWVGWLKGGTVAPTESDPDSRSPGVSPPDTDRETRLTTHLRQLLGARGNYREPDLPGSASSPLRLVLVDDPEHLDSLTRALLQRLNPLLPGSGLWLVVTATPQEAERAWPRLPSCLLHPLSREQVRSLAEDLHGVGAVRSSAALESLFQDTGGLPGRVCDTLLHPPGAGQTASRPVDVPSVQHPIASAESPSSCGSGPDASLPTLASPWSALAGALSTWDLPFDLELAERLLSSLPPADWPERLSEAGVLTSFPGRGESGPSNDARRWEIPPAIRRALQEQLPLVDRQALHLNAAEALEERLAFASATPADALSDGLAGAIVGHYLASAQPRRALPHLLRAVEEARDALRLEVAVELLNSWLALTRPADSLRAELLRRRGWLELDLVMTEAAVESFSQALEQPGLRDPLLRARCQVGLGRARFKLGRYAEAGEPLEAALNSSSVLPTLERIPVWQWLAWIYARVPPIPVPGGAPERLRPLHSADEALRQARAEGIPAGSRLEVDQLHLELSTAMLQAAVPESLVEAAWQGVTLARTLGYSAGELRLLNCLLQLAGQQGKAQLQLEIGQSLLHLARDAFRLEDEARVSNNLGLLLKGQERFLEALEHFVRAASLFGRLGQSGLQLRALHEQVDVLLRAEGPERARAAWLRAGALLQTLPRPDRLSAAAHELLESRLELHALLPRGPDAQAGLPAVAEASARDRLQALEARLDRLEADLGALEPGYLHLETLADRIELCLAGDRPREALRRLGPALEQEAVPETTLAWKRLHILAEAAHRRLRGGESIPGGPNPAPTAPPQPVPGGILPAPTVPPLSVPGEPSPAPSAPLRPAQPSVALTVLERPRAIPEGLEAPERWLDRVLKILEVADGEEQLAARLASLAGALLGGRGLVLFFPGPDQVLELEELRHNPVSNTLVRMVRETGKPYRSPDVRFDPQLSGARSIRNVARPSVICHPIQGAQGRQLGVVYVDELPERRSDDPSAVRVVEQVAELAGTLLEAFSRRRSGDDQETGGFGTLGLSSAMRRASRQIKLLSASSAPDLTVLLTGETGVGKSFVARAIHEASRWRPHPFHSVNCAAIPTELFESEMFGHRKGAFTTAFVDRAGAFEHAGEGTLFLDEIGDISPGHQAKLLTVLSERQFRRLGEERPRPFRARLVCATNRDLDAMVRQGSFREDLLSRLAVNQCRIPPLRERGPDDLRLLLCQRLQHALVQAGERTATSPLPRVEDFFTPRAQQHLYGHAWPGNVRELENLFRNELLRQRLLAGKKIDERLLSEALQGGLPPEPGSGASSPGRLGSGADLPPGLTLKELKRRCDALMGSYIQAAVDAHEGDKNAAAGAMKCARDSIYKYLNRQDSPA